MTKDEILAQLREMKSGRALRNLPTPSRAFEELSAALLLRELTVADVDWLAPYMRLVTSATVSSPLDDLHTGSRASALAALVLDKGVPYNVREGAYALLIYIVGRSAIEELTTPATRMELSGPWVRQILRRGDALADAQLAAMRVAAKSSALEDVLEDVIARAELELALEAWDEEGRDER